MNIPNIKLNEKNKLIVELYYGGPIYYFSYTTCVAIRDPHRQICMRHRDNFSVTTAKHMREMGVFDWPKGDLENV